MGLLNTYKKLKGEEHFRQLMRESSLCRMVNIASEDQSVDRSKLSRQTNISLNRLTEGLYLRCSLTKNEILDVARFLGITLEKNKTGTYDISYKNMIIKSYSF